VTAIDDGRVESVGLTPGKRYLIRDTYFPKPTAEGSAEHVNPPVGDYALDDEEIGDCLVIVAADDGYERGYGSGWFKGKFEPPSKLTTGTHRTTAL